MKHPSTFFLGFFLNHIIHSHLHISGDPLPASILSSNSQLCFFLFHKDESLCDPSSDNAGLSNIKLCEQITNSIDQGPVLQNNLQQNSQS